MISTSKLFRPTVVIGMTAIMLGNAEIVNCEITFTPNRTPVLSFIAHHPSPTFGSQAFSNVNEWFLNPLDPSGQELRARANTRLRIAPSATQEDRVNYLKRCSPIDLLRLALHFGLVRQFVSARELSNGFEKMATVDEIVSTLPGTSYQRDLDRKIRSALAWEFILTSRDQERRAMERLTAVGLDTFRSWMLDMFMKKNARSALTLNQEIRLKRYVQALTAYQRFADRNKQEPIERLLYRPFIKLRPTAIADMADYLIDVIDIQAPMALSPHLADQITAALVEKKILLSDVASSKDLIRKEKGPWIRISDEMRVGGAVTTGNITPSVVAPAPPIAPTQQNGTASNWQLDEDA